MPTAPYRRYSLPITNKNLIIQGQGNKNIVVTASENTTTTVRKCQLRIVTDDGEVTETVSIEQAAKSEDISVNVSEINLDGKANSNSSFLITSNAVWSISGVADWLTLSSTNGNGSSQIIVTAKSDNLSSSPRQCRLSIRAGQKSVSVNVIQNGMYATNCDVVPNKIVVLADGFAFDYKYDSNVAYYYVECYNPTKIERMTDSEIIAMMTQDTDDRDTPSNDSPFKRYKTKK